MKRKENRLNIKNYNATKYLNLNLRKERKNAINKTNI